MNKLETTEITPAEFEAMKKLGVSEEHIKQLVNKFGIEITKQYIKESINPRHLDEYYGVPMSMP